MRSTRFENAMAALIPRATHHDYMPYGYMPDYGSEMTEGLLEMLTIDTEAEFKTCVDITLSALGHRIGHPLKVGCIHFHV